MADPVTDNAILPVTSDTTDVAKELQTTVVSQRQGDPGHGVPATEPHGLGLDATMWVALAMIVVIVIALVKKVPAAIGTALDGRIAQIREQLDQAKGLRAEAEALRAEYEAKALTADADASAMRERAETEAAAIVARAEADATALIARRQAMAEDRIAAAERQALADVRAQTVDAATKAAARLLAERVDAGANSRIVDRAIASLGAAS